VEIIEDKGSNANNADEWGEFLHLPGQKFFDFSKIREEIVRDTEKMTGKNAGELVHFLVNAATANMIPFKVSHPTPSTCESSRPTS
jgi:hypothetical protein